MSTRSRLAHQALVLAWLVVVWLLLWGTLSWANVIGGLLVGGLVMAVLPLPPLVGGLRFRPLATLRFTGRFVADLVTSSASVAWSAVRPRGVGRGAIVAVALRTDSDLLLTVIALALSLVPGSLVLDLDREHRRMTLHLLQVRDDADLQRQRAAVFAVEERVVRAFGRPADVAALAAGGRR